MEGVGGEDDDDEELVLVGVDLGVVDLGVFDGKGALVGHRLKSTQNQGASGDRTLEPD